MRRREFIGTCGSALALATAPKIGALCDTLPAMRSLAEIHDPFVPNAPRIPLHIGDHSEADPFSYRDPCYPLVLALGPTAGAVAEGLAATHLTEYAGFYRTLATAESAVPRLLLKRLQEAQDGAWHYAALIVDASDPQAWMEAPYWTRLLRATGNRPLCALILNAPAAGLAAEWRDQLPATTIELPAGLSIASATHQAKLMFSGLFGQTHGMRGFDFLDIEEILGTQRQAQVTVFPWRDPATWGDHIRPWAQADKLTRRADFLCFLFIDYRDPGLDMMDQSFEALCGFLPDWTRGEVHPLILSKEPHDAEVCLITVENS